MDWAIRMYETITKASNYFVRQSTERIIFYSIIGIMTFSRDAQTFDFMCIIGAVYVLLGNNIYPNNNSIMTVYNATQVRMKR